MQRAIFEWEGLEYDHEPKSADWYWAVGIIATAATIAAILFADYLLALLVIVAAITVTLHATKLPSTHRFALTDHGLVIGTDLHRYETMRSFSILEHIDGTEPPFLSIKTESWISPHLVIPLKGVDAEGVYAYLLDHVDESEHHHTLTDLIAGWLGF
jgi:hypothetical protein